MQHVVNILVGNHAEDYMFAFVYAAQLLYVRGYAVTVVPRVADCERTIAQGLPTPAQAGVSHYIGKTFGYGIVEG